MLQPIQLKREIFLSRSRESHSHPQLQVFFSQECITSLAERSKELSLGEPALSAQGLPFKSPGCNLKESCTSPPALGGGYVPTANSWKRGGGADARHSRVQVTVVPRLGWNIIQKVVPVDLSQLLRFAIPRPGPAAHLGP